MEIEYRITREDYIRFNRAHFVRGFQKSILIILIIPLILAVVIAGNPLNYLSFSIAFLVGFLIFFSRYILYPYLSSESKLKKLLDEQSELFIHEGSLVTTETGLMLRKAGEEMKSAELKWQNFQSFDSNSQYIILKLVDKEVFLIPKRFFNSPRDTLDFLGIIQREINLAKGTRIRTNIPASRETQVKENKPSYLFGLFGLVPILGVGCGLIFVFLGIRKFKDKWLIIIGVAAIACSLFMHGLILTASRKLSNNFNSGFTSLSQMELNRLIQSIEFYKIQHKQYPDSLQQMLKADTLAPIIDAMQFGRKNTHYIYQKIGEKYTLYSVGHDGIPHTADDLYPRISSADRNKTGFIMPDSTMTGFR